MKATDLDDLAPVDPSDALLARVHERSRAIRRRRTTQRAVTVASGVLVLGFVFVFGIAVARDDTSNPGVRTGVPGPTTSPTTSTTVPQMTEAVISGTWRPVWIGGYSRPFDLRSPSLDLSFDGKGHWSGSDGCNSIAGRYELGPDGSFGFQEHFSTTVGCIRGTPTPMSLQGAVRVEMVNGLLTFFGRDGHQLTRFVSVPTAPLRPKPAP